MLSLFVCPGIGIVTSRIGCELNREKQVEALHASHLTFSCMDMFVELVVSLEDSTVPFPFDLVS